MSVHQSKRCFAICVAQASVICNIRLSAVSGTILRMYRSSAFFGYFSVIPGNVTFICVVSNVVMRSIVLSQDNYVKRRACTAFS